MKELKVDLFNSKEERVATSIEFSKFNIFVGNDFMNINRIMVKSRKNKLLATHTLLGSEAEVSYHKKLAYKITKRYYSDDLKCKQVVISTNSQFILYAFNNLIFNYIVKDKMPADLRDEMTCKDLMIDPNDIRIYQVEDGIVSRIQNKDGLIEHNCFDNEMSIIMNDFYKMIDYYE